MPIDNQKLLHSDGGCLLLGVVRSSNTHNCLTALCPGLLLDKPIPEETFTHSHPSWSSDIPYQLPPSTTIHSILLVQVACLTVLFHNLSSGPLWSSPWSGTFYFILHAFHHLIIIFFLQHMPIPSQPVFLFCSLAILCLQCFDAVGWAAGRASGL